MTEGIPKKCKKQKNTKNTKNTTSDCEEAYTRGKSDAYNEIFDENGRFLIDEAVSDWAKCESQLSVNKRKMKLNYLADVLATTAGIWLAIAMFIGIFKFAGLQWNFILIFIIFAKLFVPLYGVVYLIALAAYPYENFEINMIYRERKKLYAKLVAEGNLPLLEALDYSGTDKNDMLFYIRKYKEKSTKKQAEK